MFPWNFHPLKESINFIYKVIVLIALVIKNKHTNDDNNKTFIILKIFEYRLYSVSLKLNLNGIEKKILHMTCIMSRNK